MKEWIEELRAALGGCVHTDEETLRAHAADKWHASALPEAVVLPRSTDEVAAAMQVAAAHGVPVTARGAGVGYVGGCVPVQGGLVLSLAQMQRIIEVNPADGVAVVEAGVLTADLQAACAELGWFYPPDPASRKESSIGGNIATNAGGPRCLKYGVTRAYVLGLTAVLADGRVLRCGGRTHKNKQGFDLVGLFCGSEGMLGIVTEATLRIIPAPPSRAALHASFPRFALAAAAVQNVLQGGHLPAAMEITDAYTLAAARAYLGSDALPADAKGHIIIEIDGQADAVAAELTAIAAILRATGASDVVAAETEEAVEAIWQLRREFSYSLKATGLTKLNEDIVIPRSKLVELVEFCEGMQRETGIPVACFGHSGDGNIHTNVMVLKDAEGKDDRAPAMELVNRLFDWVMAQGGSITGEHGIGLAKAPWFGRAIGGVAMDLHLALKQALDPQGLLNPGKMGLCSGMSHLDAQDLILGGLDSRKLKFLTQRGIDYVYPECEQTALGMAVAYGREEAAALLLEHGADPNVFGEKAPCTPLADAYLSGNLRLFTLLLMHGADPALMTEENGTCPALTLDLEGSSAFLDHFKAEG